MVPHKVALGSSLSTDEGVRLFKPLSGKQELVLTFNLNGGVEYWQIEESNWTDAPLFANPTAQFTHKGRKYEVFTSGGAIQRIAVRRGRLRLLGAEHDPQQPVERDDDRDRRESPAAPLSGQLP